MSEILKSILKQAARVKALKSGYCVLFNLESDLFSEDPIIINYTNVCRFCFCLDIFRVIQLYGNHRCCQKHSNFLFGTGLINAVKTSQTFNTCVSDKVNQIRLNMTLSSHAAAGVFQPISQQVRA